MQQIEKRIREIYQELFDANYISGNPRIPPHTHNGIDNLPIVSTATPSAGTPGGNNTDIQFNDNGTFGGDDNLSFDKSTSTLQVKHISEIPGTGSDGITIETLESAAPIFIQTTPTAPGSSGNVTLASGDAQTMGDLTETSGNILISTGFAFGKAGDITISAGNSLNDNNGAILITTNSGGTPMDISLVSGNGIFLQGQGAPIIINVYLNIQDAGAPPATPGSGGILYTSAGALHYLGSSGTDTVIAPA